MVKQKEALRKYTNGYRVVFAFFFAAAMFFGLSVNIAWASQAFTITPDESSYDYRDVVLGNMSIHSYTIRNDGSGEWLGGELEFSPSGAGAFYCTTGLGHDCGRYDLFGGGSSKTYDIVFYPDPERLVATSYSGSLTFTSEAVAGTPDHVVNLRGRGILDTVAPSFSVTSIGGDVDTPYSTTATKPAFIFTTNEEANCRYSSADSPYDSMSFQCEIGEGTASHTCNGNSGGLSYGIGSNSVHISCADMAGNKHTGATNMSIDFNVVEAADTTPPGKPGPPSATTPTNNNMPTWSWTAPAGDPVSYLIYWDTVAGGGATGASTNTNSYTHTTALADGTWYAKVYAYDAANNISAVSDNGFVVINTSVSPPPPPPPAGPTVTVSVSASPSSGTAPLNDVEITASVGGTATGNMTYQLDCRDDGSFEYTSGSQSGASYTFDVAGQKCSYASNGTYTAKVMVTRQGVSGTGTTNITVSAPPVVPVLPTAFTSFSASPSSSTVAANTSVTYTATVNGTLGFSDPLSAHNQRAIGINDAAGLVQWCSSGTECSVTISGSAVTRTFTAYLYVNDENEGRWRLYATSSSLSTTWSAPISCGATSSSAASPLDITNRELCSTTNLLQYYFVRVPDDGRMYDVRFVLVPTTGSDFSISWENNVDPATSWSAAESTSTTCKSWISSDGEISTCSRSGLGAGVYKAVAYRFSTAGSYTISGSVSAVADTTPPTVTIARKTDQVNPTNGSPINFTATFSEPVFNFVSSDVVLGGGTDEDPLSVAVTTGDSRIYNLAVTGMLESALITVKINANAVTDVADNLNTVSNEASVIYDIARPGVEPIVQTSANVGVPINLTAAVSDSGGSGLGSCTFYIIDSSGAQTTDGVDMSAVGNAGIASLAYTFMAPGAYTVFAFCQDVAGNWNDRTGAVDTKIAVTMLTQITDFRIDPIDIANGGSVAVLGALKTSPGGVGISEKILALKCWDGRTDVSVASGATSLNGVLDDGDGNGSISWTPDITRWQGNISCKLVFAGDGSYAASESELKTLTVFPACANPDFSDSHVQPYARSIFAIWSPISGGGVTEYKVEWKQASEASWSQLHIAPAATSCVTREDGTSTCGYLIPGLTENTGYDVRVQSITDNNTACYAPAPTPPSVFARTVICAKQDEPLTDSIMSIAGSSCTAVITHIGRDVTDNSGVSYSRLNGSGSHATIEMDDELSSANDCDNDIRFTNSWTSSAGVLTVTSDLDDSAFFGFLGSTSGAHNYKYGYKISSPDCVIQNIEQKNVAGACIDGLVTECVAPTGVGTREALALQDWQNWLGSPRLVTKSVYDFSFVGCLTNDQCTAVPDQQKCNRRADGTPIVDTPSLRPNTCIDSVRPTSTIESETAFFPAPGYDSVHDQYWYKAGSYVIDIGDVDDHANNSGIARCEYLIYDGPTVIRGGSRDCGGSIDISVGFDETSDCILEGVTPRCFLATWSVDNAGNESPRTKTLFLVDRTVPTAQ